MEMAKTPVEIGALTFTRKGDATQHFRDILYAYDFGSRIPEPHHSQMRWLLERHPDSEKIGIGIDHFSVRSAIHRTRCFEVVRVNGTRTDFSLGTCVDGKASTDLAEALKALRAEVTDELRQMKWEVFRTSGLPNGKARCAISGREITLDEAHVDHMPPYSFKSIALHLLEQSSVPISPALVTPPKDNQYQPALADRSLAERWKTFYQANAKIRIVAR
jgi:hypothetical protein